MSTFAMVLMICAPFFGAGAMLAALKGLERYNQWKYEHDADLRATRMQRYNMANLRGTKKVSYDDQH